MKQQTIGAPRAALMLALVIGFAGSISTQSSAQTVPGQPLPTATMESAPVTTFGDRPIDALTNNPNGATWLDKFNRQPTDSAMPMQPGAMGSMMDKPMMSKSQMMKCKMATSQKMRATCQKMMTTSR